MHYITLHYIPWHKYCNGTTVFGVLSGVWSLQGRFNPPNQRSRGHDFRELQVDMYTFTIKQGTDGYISHWFREENGKSSTHFMPFLGGYSLVPWRVYTIPLHQKTQDRWSSQQQRIWDKTPEPKGEELPIYDLQFLAFSLGWIKKEQVFCKAQIPVSSPPFVPA